MKYRRKKYRTGGRFDSSVDSISNTALNSAVPGLGQIIQLTQQLGQSAKGDGTTIGGNITNDFLDPLSGIKDALAGNFKESIPIVGGIFEKKRRDKELEKENIAESELQKKNLMKISENILGLYPTRGNQDIEFKKGGELNSNGIDILEGGETQDLAAGISKFVGRTHENNGIKLDTDGDLNTDAEVENAEIIKGDKIFSDKLIPSDNFLKEIKKLGLSNVTKNTTYAGLAEKLAKRKGRLENNKEEKITNFRETTNKVMSKKLDDTLEELFQDQELSKKLNNDLTFETGGTLPNFSEELKKSFTSLPNKALNFIENNIPSGRYINRALFNHDPELDAAVEYQSQPEQVARQQLEIDKLKNLTNKNKTVITSNNFKMGGRVKYRDGARIPLISDSLLDNISLQDSVLEGQLKSIENLKANIKPINIENSQGNSQENIKPENNIGNFLKNNEGNIANVASFLNSDNIINKLETKRNPNLISTPPAQLTDRTSSITNRTDRDLKNIIQTIDQGNSQGRGANKAGLLAAKIQGDNEGIYNELGRQDIERARYRGLQNQTNVANASILNNTDLENLTRSNEKLGLKQENFRALVEGTVGNSVIKDQKDLAKAKMLLIAARDGDRGTVSRLLKDNPELSKLLNI